LLDEIDQQQGASLNTNRIAKNTLMLYFRQILIMLVSLYTVRVVLNVLGAEDYGIYNVVAGVVTMFSFISGAMAAASQRYFSFEIGKNDQKQLEKTFSLMLTIYCLLALCIVALAETVGLWFVYDKLLIPVERLTAAKWIYQCSILSFVLTIITTPYMASIIAHENMNVYAYMSIIEAGLKLCIVFMLRIVPYDKLIVYGILLFVVAFINTSLYRGYCKKQYKECSFRFYWNKTMFKEIMSYTGWNMFGAGVGVAKVYGINIILNQYFGPVVNAARAIASQVSSAVTSFSQNFSTAVRPQIIKTYASDKQDEMMSLVYRSCKGTYYLMYIFTLPLILEMPYVLTLWLKNPPEYTILFTRLTLIDALIDSLSFPIMTMAQATGKIKLYQGVVGGILLCNFPLSLIALHFGAPAYSIMIIAIAMTLLAAVARLFIVKRLMRFSVWNFVIKVFVPVLGITAFSAIVPCVITNGLAESFLRLAITVFTSVVLVTLCAYFVGCSCSERRYIKSYLKKALHR
jgi:O-antigen/teichoic acid export membrane protein